MSTELPRQRLESSTHSKLQHPSIKNTHIGDAEFITSQNITVMESESEDEKENFTSARRVTFMKQYNRDKTITRQTGYTKSPTLPNEQENGVHETVPRPFENPIYAIKQ